jgi:hypothetical protein
MSEDDYEEEFVDSEDEIFNDEEIEDLDEDDSCSAEEEGFMRGYKEAGKKKEEDEED